MFAVAYVVGFRIEGTILEALAATALMFAFSYAFSWIASDRPVGRLGRGGQLGRLHLDVPADVHLLRVRRPEPMVDWLQPIAENNPFTILTDACRALYNGYDPGNDVWIALAWAVGITVVFSVIATRKFARSTSA